MIPGTGRMHPKQVKQMMKRMGISTEEIKDVEQIIIKTSSKDYVFDKAEVTIMIVQNQKTFQIVGEPKIIEKEITLKIPQEDIQLVAQQAGVSEEEAKRALEECNGEPAEAIIKLMGEGK